MDEATFSALAELAGDDDPDLVTDLIELFLDDSSLRMDQIVKAIEAGDGTDGVEAIGRAAHALKSSSANIGALAFSEACAQLERLAREGESEEADIAALVERSATMYAEVRAALDSSSSAA